MLKNKSILKIIAVLTIIVMSMFALTGCGKNDKEEEKKKEETAYEEPVKNLVEGLSEANAEKFAKAFPPYLADQMKEIFTADYLQKSLEEAKEQYGENVSMTYTVTSKEEISEDDIKTKEEDIKSSFEKEVDITKGYKLNIEITTKGDDAEDKDTSSFDVYEMDGNWYILGF